MPGQTDDLIGGGATSCLFLRPTSQITPALESPSGGMRVKTDGFQPEDTQTRIFYTCMGALYESPIEKCIDHSVYRNI